jgi:hypothetical protein
MIMKIFVIMPFSETTATHDEKYWDYFYKKVCDIVHRKNYETIKKMFNVHDFKISRASAPQGNITKSILIDLKESDIVIAILTDQNPNVFYELGVRHTQSNKTIMLCEKSQRIPFDLSVYGVGFYKDNKLRFRYIEKELLERLKQIALNRDKPDNPFYDFVISSKSSIGLQKPEIKVSIVNQIDGEPLPYPPMFYREALRKGGGEVDYKDRTFFTFIIELMNYGTEPISLFDSKLQVTISSQNFSTDTLYHESHIDTAKGYISIRPKYKKKFTLEPREIYQDHIAFVLDQSVPKEISEICGNVYVIDMFGNEYSSPEIKFAPSPYC